MDIEKFYETLGVDYNIVLRRLQRESLIDKYLHLFLKDNSFARLKETMADRNYEEAFKAVHTLKGVSMNLELAPLSNAASELSDYLKFHTGGSVDSAAAGEKYEKVRTEYETIQRLID